MENLSEALSKSMIKKLKKHNTVLTKFTKKDLENGDLLIEADNTVWMYLDADEMNYRINEFKEFKNSDIQQLQKHNGFIVNSPKEEYYRNRYGLFRISINEINENNNNFFYNSKIFTKLIKCGNKYLNNNLTINEIYYMNNFFEDYL